MCKRLIQKIATYKKEKRKIPSKLYKYRSLQIVYNENGEKVSDGMERCIDIIKNHRLYFPRREDLNDPYEGVAVPIKLGVCGESLYEALGQYHNIIQEKIDKYKVLSLSATPLNMQMWAHYANNYDGICFEFDRKGIFTKASAVEYIRKPFATVYEPEFEEMEKIINQNFFYKSKHWDYEREYRIVSKTEEKYIQFNKSQLTGIIIGSKAMEREDVKERLIKLANEENIPVYYTFFTPKEYKLSIVTKEDIMDLGGIELKDVLYL